MQINGKRKFICAVILAVTLPNISWAETEPLQQRVERLERIIQGQGLMNLITRVDQLQNEIQRLNGDNETLRHELEQAQKRQKEMYIDLDERMQKLETNASTNASNSVSSDEPADTSMANAGINETTDEPSPTDAAPVAVENGEAAYQAALQTLRSGQYQQAIDALAKFPEQYPGSVYLPNAYYWQGEAKYVLRQFADAAALFQIVIDEYPTSSKVADALLKRGFSEQEMGDSQRAEATLNQVVEKYPNSSAARLAKARLERINQQAN